VVSGLGTSAKVVYWTNNNDLKLSSPYSAAATLEIKRPTTIGAFNPSDLYLMGLTNSNYLIPGNDQPINIKIQITFVGCVKDPISLTPSALK
jgi:hypothetical protein